MCPVFNSHLTKKLEIRTFTLSQSKSSSVVKEKPDFQKFTKLNLNIKVTEVFTALPFKHAEVFVDVAQLLHIASVRMYRCALKVNTYTLNDTDKIRTSNPRNGM